MMSNGSISEAEAVAAISKSLNAVLPDSWVLGPLARDGTVLLKAGRTQIRFQVEVRKSFEPRLVSRLIDPLRNRQGVAEGDELPAIAGALLIAPYFSPRARTLLSSAGWSYADLSGNARLVSQRPPLYVMIAGSNRAPRSEPRPVRTLRGTAAGRLVRALADLPAPIEFKDIALRSGVSSAQVSRLVRLLERDALVEREGRGTLRSVDWAALLRRWAEDYRFLEANRIFRYVALRGREALLDRLRATTSRYAITGGVAAETMRTSAPSRVTVIYAERAAELAGDLELEPVPENPTVLLAEPWNPVVFERTVEREGLIYVAPTQVVADLLTSGDRNPMVAEAVLDWMKEHEREWRR